MLYQGIINMRSLSHDTLRVLVVDQEYDDARHLADIVRRWGAQEVHQATGYASALKTLCADPEAYPLVILGAGSIDESLLTWVERFARERPVAVLVLASAVDTRAYTAVLNRMPDVIADCDIKTRERVAMFNYLDDMLALINQKLHYVLNPFGVFG